MGRCAAAGVSVDEYLNEAMAAVTQAPEVSSEAIRDSMALMEARGGNTVAEMFQRDFATALEIQIAGIDTMVARARPEASAWSPPGPRLVPA